MDFLRTVFSLFVVPAFIIGLIIFGMGKAGQKEREAKESKAAKQHQSYLQTEKGYRENLIHNQLQLVVETDYINSHVWLRSALTNKGGKDLANVKVRIVYLSKARAGENRPEYIDLGPLKKGERKEYNRKLYKGTASMYRVEIKQITFR